MESLRTGSSTKSRILIVDDDPDLRYILADRLRAEGHEAEEAGDIAGARAALARERFHMICLDVFLPDQEELEGMREIRLRFPEIPVVILTAQGSTELATKALASGAYDFLTKPLEFVRLKAVVDRALERSALIRELRDLKLRESALFAQPLEAIEKHAILAALERHDGNRTKAATALGIGRRTLQNKLKRYRLAAKGASGAS